ncbi:MAG: hypothetical protein EB059_06430 [Alphaproteobacteria bacterium]|nr:hypothetical protein [Alphaproteobacteria bacterium]
MQRTLLKTVSVLALSLFVLPALAAYSDNDPYGYDTVPLPPPQPQAVASTMVMPSYQAQQTSPMARRSPYGLLYATAPSVTPSTITPSTAQQASSVGYVVQPQQGGTQQAPQQYQQQYQQPAYAQAQPQGVQVTTTVQQQPYGQASVQQYAAPVAPSYGTQAPQIQVQAPQALSAPQVTATAPYPTATYGAPTSSYTQQTSITTAPTYDNSAASYQQVPQQYAAAAPSYAQPQPVQQADLYSYNAPAPQATYQQQTTTTYAPQQPALTVVQNDTSVYSPATQTAPAYNNNVSLSSEPGYSPFYFALRTGLTVPNDTKFRTATANIENEYTVGWQLGTAVGYNFRPFNAWLSPRAEIEMTYDQQTVDAHKINGVKTSDPNAYGFIRNLDILANGFLDFRVNRILAPYVGGGIGLGYTDFDRVGTSAAGVVMDDNDVGFVWQAMGGLGIRLAAGSMFDIGYRFQQNTGATLKARDGSQSTTEASKHVFLLGFRNNF